VYGAQVAVALRNIKYRGAAHACGPLGRLLTPLLRTGGPVDLVVPVPLHPRRLRERGYNQAALLARAAIRGTGLEICFRALRRERWTDSQAALGRAARQENLRGAFAGNRSVVSGGRILLVDDVLTTGATGIACSDALLEAGAREVQVVTVARATL
jgi:ComF family protein